MNKKILIASCVRQKSHIFKEFIESLNGLKYPKGYEVERYFVFHNCFEELKGYIDDCDLHTSYYNESEWDNLEKNTHKWDSGNFSAVIEMKNHIIKFAKDNNYDYLFIVDSDLVLHPNTLCQLYEDNKDIIANIFWTKWNENSQEFGSNCWDTDYNTVYGNSNKWLTEGVYQVGGTGACTLIKKEVLDKDINFSPIYNVSFANWNNGICWEDRCFQIRASVNGYKLYIDTHYPAYHLYRQKEYEQFMEEKKNRYLFKQNYEIINLEKLKHSVCVLNSFSIIIPLYDEINYVDKALKSIQNQTYKGMYEIILVCNNTLSELDKNRLKNMLDECNIPYTFINDTSKDTPGFSRNLGLEKAKGDYILFLDSDDTYLPNALELINSELNNLPDISHFNFILKDEKSGNKWISDVNKDTTDKWHICWNKAFKTDFLKDIRFNTDIKMSEDLEFYKDCLKKSPKEKFSETFIIQHLKNRKGSLQYKVLEKRSQCNIDIIIPIYNSYKTIFNMLDGIKSQTQLNNLSVILVDDCSTDDFKDNYDNIIKQYNNYFNIKIVRNEKNVGAGISRQNGFDVSDGEYVFFFDADDCIINNNFIKQIREIIKIYYPDVIWNRIQKTDIQGTIYTDKMKQTAHLQDKCYKREYLVDNNIRFHNKLRFAEDAYFNYLALYKTNNIVHTEIVYYRCLINNESYTLKNFDQVVIEKIDETLIGLFDSAIKLNNPMKYFLISYAFFWLYEAVNYCDIYIKNFNIDKIIDNVIYPRGNIISSVGIDNIISNKMLSDSKIQIEQDFRGRIGVNFIEKISFYDFTKKIIDKINKV